MAHIKKHLKLLQERSKITGRHRAFLMTFYELLYKNLKSCPRMAYFFLSLKHKQVLIYLESINQLPPIPEDIPRPKKAVDEPTIWVFWWQGADQMPELVKACFHSIRKHCGVYKVQLLTKDNITEYLDIPILDKVGKTITYTNFSDYLRLSLLSIYGGGWVDATIFLTKDIPDNMPSHEYYTIRHPEKKFVCISNFRWCGSFIFTHSCNPLVTQVRDLFIKYWKCNSLLIDYFLIDYCFAYVLGHNKECQTMLEKVPFNNPDAYTGLGSLLSAPYDKDLYEQVSAETWIHKLSYKAACRSDASQPTFYDFITQEAKKATLC